MTAESSLGEKSTCISDTEGPLMTTQGGLGLRQSGLQFKTHDGETVNATQPEGVTVMMIALWMMGAK